MAFMDKVQSLLHKMKPQQEEPGMRSNLATGGFSGYHPKVKEPEKNRTKEQASETAQFSGRQPIDGMSHMVPPGVNPSILNNMQDMSGQTGHMQQGQMMNGQAPGYGQTAQQQYQQNWAQPQQASHTSWQQPAQAQPFGQAPQFGQAAQFGQAPQFGQAQQVPPAQPEKQNAAAQPNNVYYFPGQRPVVDEQGNVYRMTMRVAQITGVNSCYGLIEFMQNQEAIIVNAEYITDKSEADRCFDMLFGAAYAMQQRFSRISGRQIYLISPRDMQVMPCDRSSRLGAEDMMNRWPGSMQTEQGRAMQPQSRVDDFAGTPGRRAPLGSQPAGMYTDFGGFGKHG